MNRTAPRAERVRVEGASAILGVSRRDVLAMAANGKLPTAAKLGRSWTFDEHTLRQFAADPKSFEDVIRPDFEPIRPMSAFALHEGPSDRVYVVGFGPYVKIGFSASAKGKRLRGLQTAIPQKLEVYGYLPGGLDLETDLHKMFEAYRLQGEWFRKRGTLARWIADGCQVPTRRRRERAWK